MTGLPLRYCCRCNSTSTVAASAKGLCPECGEQAQSVDAHALIPALGAKLDQTQRREVVDKAQAAQ